MKENIQNITIEALFEKDKEVLFVELRDRAETAGMDRDDFHTEFRDALKDCHIEIDAIGNVKLMGA